MSTFEASSQATKSGLATAALFCGLIGLCCALVVFSWLMLSMAHQEHTGTPEVDQIAATLVSWLLHLVALGFGAMATAFGLVEIVRARRATRKPPFQAKLGLSIGILAVVLVILTFIIGVAGAFLQFGQMEEYFKRRRVL